MEFANINKKQVIGQLVDAKLSKKVKYNMKNTSLNEK